MFTEGELWVPKAPGLVLPPAFDELVYDRLASKLAGRNESGRVTGSKVGGPDEAPAGGSLSFTYIGAATSTTSAVDISGTGLAAGDFAIYCDYANDDGSGSVAAVTPSGFTVLNNTSATGTRIMASAKILSGSEGSITGMNGDGNNQKIVLIFHPSIALASFAANDPHSQSTSGNPTSQTVLAASTGSYPIIVYGHMGGESGFGTRTTSPAMDEVPGANNTHYAHYRIYASGALDQTYDMGDLGSRNGLESGYLTFTT